MRRHACLLLVALGCVPCLLAAPVSRSRHVRLGRVVLSAPIPADMRSPEGKSRWDLAAAVRREFWIRTSEARDRSVTVRDQREDGKKPSTTTAVYQDTAGGDAALNWFFPEAGPHDFRLGTRGDLELQEEKEGRADRLRIETEIVGIGWVHLPSGPHEVVLQRARMERIPEGSRWAEPPSLIYRWVDPRLGVVAEVSGKESAWGPDRLLAEKAMVLEESLDAAATLKIHVSELYSPPLQDITYGWDRPGTCSSTAGPCNIDKDCPTTNPAQHCLKNVNTLTSPSFATVGDLIAANTWDFSGNTTGAEVGSTTTAINSAETCNFNQCGYTTPGAYLERTDKSFNVPANLYKINDAAQREDRVGDVTLWLRAGVQNEGVAGSLGSGESGFCYTTVGTTVRTPVPLWQFTHLDAGSTDRYFQAGDSWQGGPFNCEQNLFNQVCGGGGVGSALFTKGCTDASTGVHNGTHSVSVLKGGVITLPSGHTFNALLARNVADFCVYLFSGCASFGKVDTVRTVNYLWQVPHLGTVVRFQSQQNAPADYTSFSLLAETDIHFGLFPPRSISVTGSTNTSVSLSWDPGSDTHRITDYKVYWDTDSGSSSGYAFNSVSNPGQISFSGTTATVSGLTPGVTYYFTVTSRSTFTDPSSGVVTTYESLLYPTQVSGDPTFVYPVEVQATTLCPATAEVTGVTVNTTGTPGEIQICWNPATDACLAGYQILGANSPTSDTNYSVVANTGLTTCWTGSPTQIFYLVVARGTGANGPWGHYGH